MSPVEKYLQHLLAIRSSGDATDESSYYTALNNLLDEVGKELKPRVRCILQLKNRGAGHPDGGLYTPDQFQKGDAEPIAGQKPARGALEVKATKDDAFVTADTEQVTKYWKAYGQVLVTNYRDFVLVGRDIEGKPVKLASYRLASDEKAFWKAASQPVKAAKEQGERFVDFLKLAMLSPAVLAAPKDVAWVLGYYAREANARVAAQAELPALANVRAALEQALGLKFEGTKGDHFFRSSLIQTLFYGVFSAWVLWSRQLAPTSKEKFDWKLAQWSLRVPMIRALFEQVATPGRLEALGLVEVLSWTATALNRVDRAEFFSKFQEQEAVQYFYEPFLQAFDPQLRKELGVWYTPLEVVKYMVARADAVLREELGLADGLADKNVYVLDPACGTGAYLVQVLRTIIATLNAKGKDSLIAHDVKRAAMERVFGFEVLPAPFVISHLQLGLLLQNISAPLADDGTERVGVYLTNSLTGWEPPKGPKQHLIFPEMEAERDAAAKVKREAPILVVIGNPPYNGFSGVGMDEEQELVDAYRNPKRAPAPQGQGLLDLYVRFLRVGERKIVDGTGSGIVCYISNYSWLDGFSHTGMRERYLEVFDRIWIDSLNGDAFRTGKRTPDGKPDPSVFSTEQNPVGIQIGTSIALLVRRPQHKEAETVLYREFWGANKRADLTKALTPEKQSSYIELHPTAAAGYPFMPHTVEAEYAKWPRITETFPVMSPGVKTSRDAFLVDVDRDRLEKRLKKFFDSAISHEEMARISPDVMASTKRFDARQTREHLRQRGRGKGKIVKYEYRPFDCFYLYWDPETKLLDEKREDLYELASLNNRFLTSRQKRERDREGTPFYSTSHLPDWHLTRPGAACFPLLKHPSGQGNLGEMKSGSDFCNLSETAHRYLLAMKADINFEDSKLIWSHILAIGYSPLYLRTNEDGMRQDWPRIPMPATLDILTSSAKLGGKIAALLDSESAVQGVTGGLIQPELQVIANISSLTGKSLSIPKDLLVEVGWGHPGKEGITMPGSGRVAERDYSDEEREAIERGAQSLGSTLEEALAQLGASTFDIFLNDRACWKNVPRNVWLYTIGGYQVMKKWLSYRESKLLGRAITIDEARHVRDMARRIATICLLQPALDANYAAVKDDAYPWPVQVKQTNAEQMNE